MYQLLNGIYTQKFNRLHGRVGHFLLCQFDDRLYFNYTEQLQAFYISKPMWTATKINPFPKNTGIDHISDALLNDEDRPTINILAMDTMLDQAYEWLCVQREHLSHNNSVWDVRFNWRELKPLTHGIPKGCPLSPLIAAFYLKPLDDEMHQQGFYIRFMDDRLVMVKIKRQLRKIIKLTHRILNQIKLKMHPDKTYLGCIKKGFDFLGIHFGELSELSKTSLENHRFKLAQRYAQGVSSACIGRYIERWTSWCKSLLQYCSSHFDDSNLPG
jgi:hypothetical protein